MNNFILAGSILAILTYFPLWWQIRKGKARQNFLTWVLWSSLDAIAVGSIIAQNGNYLLPLAYSFGSAVTVYVIVKAGIKAEWTWFETMVVTLVFASIVVWYCSGNKLATVASTTAMAIATFPQLRDAYKKPHEMPVLAYFSYFVANCLSTAGGKNWSIEERFYPAVASIACFVVTVVAARKFLQKRESMNPA